MNKQEAIEKVKTMTVETFFSGTLFVKQQEVIAIIEQIGEPTSGCAEEAKKSNKVVIPQFVADWIEVCKENLTSSLYTAMNQNFMKENNQSFDLIFWIKKSSNQNIFARAWLDGYEAEKEKLYTAQLRLVTQNEKGYLNKNSKSDDFFIDDLRVFSGDYQTSFTRPELEDLDIWDNPAFEIKEVE